MVATLNTASTGGLVVAQVVPPSNRKVLDSNLDMCAIPVSNAGGTLRRPECRRPKNEPFTTLVRENK